MKIFLLKLILFSCCFFLFDKLFIPVMNYSPQIQKDKRIESMINGEINKKLIVLGSSRGARNVIASGLESATGMSAYNLSYPGSDIEFHEFILRSLLKFNKPPKAVLLVVDDPSELLPSESITFRYESLYPYVKYPHIIEEMVRRKEKNRLLAELLILYRMNSSNFNFRKINFTPYDSLMKCGSMPVSFISDSNLKFDEARIHYNKENEVPEKIVAFQKLNMLCTENNIKLIIVFPPNYKNYSTAFEQRIRELSRKEVLFYVYNSNNPVYRNKNYYADENHLVLEGSKKFTAEIASYISSSKLGHPQ
ncbi:MAG: DUF1574 domain-containing protein [Bacteroidota bacterium]|nr:DUF1574 domain-containing protein [Bacteroidota bacterium]